MKIAQVFLFGALIFLALAKDAQAYDMCSDKADALADLTPIFKVINNDAGTVHETLDKAIEAKTSQYKPIKMIPTGHPGIKEFPSYSACEKSFFRVATVPKKIDQFITQDGWKSGWIRRKEELEASGQDVVNSKFDALAPSTSFEDRIVQYVRVKDKKSNFPKHSSVVGVLENPIRTLSVGYHTGYNEGIAGSPMRMDEIEVGPCATAPECQKIVPYSSEKVFKDKALTPRYSVEGEWAIENQIPPACVVATYRIKFQKVDDVCYSDANGNCVKK